MSFCASNATHQDEPKDVAINILFLLCGTFTVLFNLLVAYIAISHVDFQQKPNQVSSGVFFVQLNG